MTELSLADLERLFFGSASGESNVDSSSSVLQEWADAGLSLSDVLELTKNEWRGAQFVLAQPNEETILEVVNGVLTQRNVVLAEGGSYTWTLITLPPAKNHLGATVRVSCVNVSGVDPSFGICEKIEEPTVGTMNFGAVGTAILGLYTGTPVTFDLTTATLGHPFVIHGYVDGVEFTSDPLDDVYGPMGPGSLGEYVRLLSDIAASFLSAGATINMDNGIVSSPTSGVGSEVRFAGDQEHIETVDLAAVSDPVAGKLGYFRGIDDKDCYAGIDDYYSSGSWEYSGSRSPVLGESMLGVNRYLEVRAIATNEDGTEAKWSAANWPKMATDIRIPSDDPSVSFLSNLAAKLLVVGENREGGALANGDYVLGLTVTDGVASVDWVTP